MNLPFLLRQAAAANDGGAGPAIRLNADRASTILFMASSLRLGEPTAIAMIVRTGSGACITKQAPSFGPLLSGQRQYCAAVTGPIVNVSVCIAIYLRNSIEEA